MSKHLLPFNRKKSLIETDSFVGVICLGGVERGERREKRREERERTVVYVYDRFL